MTLDLINFLEHNLLYKYSKYIINLKAKDAFNRIRKSAFSVFRFMDL